jgi:hypothetical protein
MSRYIGDMQKQKDRAATRNRKVRLWSMWPPFRPGLGVIIDEWSSSFNSTLYPLAVAYLGRRAGELRLATSLLSLWMCASFKCNTTNNVKVVQACKVMMNVNRLEKPFPRLPKQVSRNPLF